MESSIECIGVKSLGIAKHFAYPDLFRPSNHHSRGRESICRSCKAAYNNARIKGDIEVNSRDKSVVGRFLAALEVSKEAALTVLKDEANITDGECWEWKKSVASGGYGAFRITRSSKPSYIPNFQMVHHWSFWLSDAYEDFETIHHKCANRICFNPAHLEKATLRSNVGEMFARRAYEVRISQLEQKVIELQMEIDVMKGVRSADSR